jgi:hypothetical protein
MTVKKEIFIGLAYIAFNLFHAYTNVDGIQQELLFSKLLFSIPFTGTQIGVILKSSVFWDILIVVSH